MCRKKFQKNIFNENSNFLYFNSPFYNSDYTAVGQSNWKTKVDFHPNIPKFPPFVDRSIQATCMTDNWDAVFYRWVSTLRHKYGSKILFRTTNVVLLLSPRNPAFSEKIIVLHFFHHKISKSTMQKSQFYWNLLELLTRSGRLSHKM